MDVFFFLLSLTFIELVPGVARCPLLPYFTALVFTHFRQVNDRS